MAPQARRAGTALETEETLAAIVLADSFTQVTNVVRWPGVGREGMSWIRKLAGPAPSWMGGPVLLALARGARESGLSVVLCLCDCVQLN